MGNKKFERLADKYRKACSKKVKASFTIEAAVIVPISLVIVVTMIFLTFYLHDKITMSAESEIAVLENVENNDDDSSEIKTDLQTLLEGKTLMSRNIGVDSDTEEGSWVVRTTGSFSLPIPLMQDILGSNMESIQTEINISNLDARNQLLKYKAICDGIEGSGVIDFDD